LSEILIERWARGEELESGGATWRGIQRIETNLVPLYKRDIMERSARSGGVFERCGRGDEESYVDFQEFVKLGLRLDVELSFIGPNHYDTAAALIHITSNFTSTGLYIFVLISMS
jgi:hypothetical protein